MNPPQSTQKTESPESRSETDSTPDRVKKTRKRIPQSCEGCRRRKLKVGFWTAWLTIVRPSTSCLWKLYQTRWPGNLYLRSTPWGRKDSDPPYTTRTTRKSGPRNHILACCCRGQRRTTTPWRRRRSSHSKFRKVTATRKRWQTSLLWSQFTICNHARSSWNT